MNGRRRHAEDLCSALGQPSGAKYGVQAAAIARFLDHYGCSGTFIRQLAFNAAIGNGDAHAKNYSVLLDGENVELAPLYDCVPTMLFGDHTFAQRIGTAREITALTPAAWISFAQEAHLAPEFVWENVMPVMSAVAQHLDYAFADTDLTPQGRKAITKRVKALRRYCLPA